MTDGRHRPAGGRRDAFLVAAALVAAAALAAIVLALVDLLSIWGAVAFAGAVIGGGLALLGWRRAARVADVAAANEDATARELGETRAELETQVARADDAERRLEQERRGRERAEEARRSEHQWARELRAQVLRLQHIRGPLGDSGDIRDLILRVALDLLNAEKGMLLARTDADHDGNLDVAASQGFEHDPSDSAVAQRFANEVIERDVTIREADASRYRNTPADDEIRNLVAIPIYIRDEFSGVLVAANKEGGFHDYDDEVLLSLGDHAGAVMQNARLHGELRTSYRTTVAMLADAVEAKDPFTRHHSNDCSRYVAAVAKELGFDEKRREELAFAALLHDVGKIGISERILLKPAPLTREERAVIELHPRIGYRLVEQVPVLESIALAVLHHHERWDGAGYPSGLKGEDIPLEARVVAVADSFSAMTSDRPYRARRTVDEALDELRRCAGTQFDPQIVRLFVDAVEREPPTMHDEHTFAGALDDPEFETKRREDEPLLGFGSFASIDNLTHLYAHRAFQEVARAAGEVATVQGKPFAVLMVELTDLPRINRDDGYRAGDDAIAAVARAVQTVAGRCGGTAGRYSGRRIALLCPDTGEEAATQLAEEIAAEVDDRVPIHVLTAVWQEGESGEDVVERARLGAATPVPG